MTGQHGSVRGEVGRWHGGRGGGRRSRVAREALALLISP